MQQLQFVELRKRMLSAGVGKVKDLAELTGISPSTLGNRMRGEFPFTAWEMIRISEVLEIPLEEMGEVFCGQDMRRGKSAELERAAKQAVTKQRRRVQIEMRERGLG